MFANEVAAIEQIRAKLSEIEEEMLPASFTGDDEVEEAFNVIRRHLATISTGLAFAKKEMENMENRES